MTKTLFEWVFYLLTL